MDENNFNTFNEMFFDVSKKIDDNTAAETNGDDYWQTTEGEWTDQSSMFYDDSNWHMPGDEPQSYYSSQAATEAQESSGFEIKRHNFESDKEAIKEFINGARNDIKLNFVNSSKGAGEWFKEYFTGGGFGFDHKVTGSEFNKLVGEVQDCLLDVNKTIQNIMNGFMKVYNTFDSLDNDYIKGLLINDKEIDEENQERIDSLAELVLSIKKLREYQKQLDSYVHLRDIDEMYDHLNRINETCCDIRNECNNLNDKFEGFSEALGDLTDSLDREVSRIDSILQEESEANKESAKKIDKRVKYAFLIAGGSLGLSVIELIIIFAKLIF